MGGTCVAEPAGAGCCRKDSDCDDRNGCTTDRCVEGASCGHDKVANCVCQQDSDCPSGDRCVDGACQGPPPDGGKQVSAYATGDGVYGSCSMKGSGAWGQGSGAWMVALALVLLALRGRRARVTL
jgi:hypothetical protein